VGIDEPEHFDERLDRRVQCVLEEVLLRVHEPVLLDTGVDDLAKLVRVARLHEEAEDVALVHRGHRRIEIRLAREHHADRLR
jgi:hypothetical protein